MTAKHADQAGARRRLRIKQIIAGALAVAAIIAAAAATKLALDGQWVAWGEPYGPPGSPRTLAKYEVTNEEFDACDTCRDRGKKRTPESAICLGQVQEVRRTIAVTKSTEPESEVCVRWTDAMAIADALTSGYGHRYRCYRKGRWRRRCEKEGNDVGFRLAVGETVLRNADKAKELGVIEQIALDCQVRIAIPSPKRGYSSNPQHNSKKFYTARLGPARTREDQAVQCITSQEAKRYANWMSERHEMAPCYGEAGTERKKGEPRAEGTTGSASQTVETSEEEAARETISAGACRGYRLPTRKEWREAKRSGADGEKEEDKTGSAPEAVRALCGDKTSGLKCTGAESGRELDGIDETKHGVVGLTVGVREMVHTEKGLGTMGWSSVDVRQYVMASTAPKRFGMDPRWEREETEARRTRGKITTRSSQIGFRLIEPSDPLGMKEWVRMLLTGNRGS